MSGNASVSDVSSVVADGVTAAGEAATVAATPAKRSGRPRQADSNMSKARAIFQSYSDVSDKVVAREIKARFVAELAKGDGTPMSKQTANTYFYLLSKEQA